METTTNPWIEAARKALAKAETAAPAWRGIVYPSSVVYQYRPYNDGPPTDEEAACAEEALALVAQPVRASMGSVVTTYYRKG